MNWGSRVEGIREKNKAALLGSIIMVDYHFLYYDVEGEFTHWDAIQRKLGNLSQMKFLYFMKWDDIQRKLGNLPQMKF